MGIMKQWVELYLVPGVVWVKVGEGREKVLRQRLKSALRASECEKS